jgi:hypothetical protein
VQPYAAEDNLSSEHTRDKVKETLNLIRTAGFKVVRIWAFSNGPDPWNIHKSPGGKWAHAAACLLALDPRYPAKGRLLHGVSD